jgi:inosine triphosphate pyrophosphatase
MRTLYFITGNTNKLREVKSFFPDVQGLTTDLPEIQSLDIEEVIKYKIQEAFKHCDGNVLVEDTSLSFDALNGLPGPLVKWFMTTIGVEGLYAIAEKFCNTKAVAKTALGYATSCRDIHFFESEIHGTIVRPDGENGFGWDVIFRPDGHQQTFAKMSAEEKNSISMRANVLSQLKLHLERGF